QRAPARGHEPDLRPFYGPPSLAFSPDTARPRLACAWGKYLCVWNPRTGTAVWRERRGDEVFRCVVFSRCGDFVVSGSLTCPSRRAQRQTWVTVWEANMGKRLQRLPGDPAEEVSLALSQDGQLLAVADRAVRVLEVVSGQEVWRGTTGNQPHSVAF